MLKRALWFILLLLAPVVVQAAVYTPSSLPNPKEAGQELYVVNPDGIISADDVDWLNKCANDLYSGTQVELCVVAIESIGEMDAFDFAYELFQRWGIGGMGKNTGVLMLFVLDSRDIRLMTGVGIEGVLPDAKCSQIIHDNMIPAFKEGDYGGGLCLGALKIYEICTNGEAPEELLNAQSVTNRGKYVEHEDETELWVLLLVAGGVVVVLYVIAKLAALKRCPKCHKLRAKATQEKVLLAATYQHEGKGERTYKCAHCGEIFIVPFVIARRVRQSSGGFGGGSLGGGHSGGGFSGGSWGGGSTLGGGAGGKW